jgi:hypothetical protein
MNGASPNTRFPFSVERSGDLALILMDCGGVIRARKMTAILLATIGELCRRLRDAAQEVMPDDTRIPDYPRFVKIADGEVSGVCHAIMGVCRVDGRVELSIALYDDGDDSAPILLLVDEEIDDFVRRSEE